MSRSVVTVVATAGIALTAAVLSPQAHADRWEVRQEVREGYYEVERAKRQAEREIRRCNTRECARREIREGYRDVEREKREARREIRRELRDDYYQDRYHRKRDRDDNDFLKGAVVGAAAVGVAVAIAKSNDD